MINVPDHQPDTMDEQAFRRMLTASPACPVEAGPISNAQLRELKQRKKQLPRHRGSLDLGYSFNPGSPLPASEPVEPRNIKQKVSKLRLSKKSSKDKSRGSDTYRSNKHHESVNIDPESTLLADTARSAGLVDILPPLDASVRGYDSDAEVIKTPEFKDVAAVIESVSETGGETSKKVDLVSHDSMSNGNSSSWPVEASTDTSAENLSRCSSHPRTPDKISFTDALQPNSSETPGVVLKRLSAGIANGTIKLPTDLELRNLNAPISQAISDDWKLSLQAPLRWSSLKDEPGTPQTAIRRFSNPVQSKGEDELNGNLSEKDPDSKRASLVALLEPNLLQYISRLAEMQSLDLTLYDDTAIAKIATKEEDHFAVEPVARDGDLTSSEPKPENRSSVEVTSIISAAPSEHNSVHLFNMNIPTRLENRSKATIMSPATSMNNSTSSLNSPPLLPSVLRNSPVRRTATFGSGRAEHNRKPSDPQTRQIFEQPGRRYRPYWKSSATSINKSKSFRERDDASSIYSIDCGAPPSTSEVSYIASPLNVRKNVNSLAIGGRSASTEIPIRRSSRTRSCALTVPVRTFSITERGQKDQLNAAAEVISKYYDGENDVDTGYEGTSSLSEAIAPRENTTIKVTSPDDDISSSKLISGTKTRGHNTDLLTPAKRSAWDSESMNQDFSTDLIKDFNSSRDRIDSNVSALKESATDLWNRAYREARGQSQPGDFLSHDDLDTENLHRRPSYATPRLRHRSSSILQTPKSALRRSISADPVGRQSLRGGENDASNGTGRLANRMKRLSIWQLKPQKKQESSDYVTRKLAERSDVEVKTRKSFTTFETNPRTDFCAAHTPPLSHYLGYWGSFPSHTRAERNGPAGEPDDVLARNFGAEQTGKDANDTDPARLRSRLSTGTLSLMQSTSKKFFPGRSSKTKSKTVVFGSPNHRVEKNQVVALKRWKRQFRTKSTEWRGYKTARGHRSSISPERPARHPELGSLPNQGLFGEPQISSTNDVDSESFESVPLIASIDSHADQTIKMTNAATETVEQQDKGNASSIWESFKFANESEPDQRLKENVRLSSGAAGLPRASKDLKMPGRFEEY